jgi:hypothetical protein
MKATGVRKMAVQPPNWVSLWRLNRHFEREFPLMQSQALPCVAPLAEEESDCARSFAATSKVQNEPEFRPELAPV